MKGLASLLAVQPPGGSRPGPPDAAALADGLRLQLAVRGWVDPHRLLPEDLQEATATSVLETLAPEVATAWKAYPGQWSLRDPERRVVLTASAPDAIIAALDDDRLDQDAADPVRQALKLRRAPLPGDLDALGTDVLSALLSSLAWLAPPPDPQPAGASVWHAEDLADAREQISATLALVRRREDIARMTQATLFGRDDAYKQLIAIATEPLAAGACGAFVYLSGVGGAGKSTVFAHVEQALRSRAAPPLLVHLDCDQPDFDPADPIAMDIALFRRVSVARPAAAPGLRQRIAQLRQAELNSALGYRERTSRQPSARADAPGIQPASRIRPGPSTKAVASYALLEAAVTERASARESVSWNALAGVGEGNPLVLLIDTAELIFARGQDAALMVAGWITSLGPTLGAEDLRVILAGRDPPDAPGPAVVASRLGQGDDAPGWQLHPPVTLDDLDEVDAQQMLASLGMSDPVLAERTAHLLPRTPLILRIAADLYAASPEERAAFVEAVSNDGIDPRIISRYLTERVVRHMASATARPYVLAAMVLPEVTPALLAEVVIPTVDAADGRSPATGDAATQLATDVFQGLLAAGWLVRPLAGRMQLTFHPEMRRLALTLMEQHEEKAKLVKTVREQALAFYSARRSASDRTFAAYFAALLGRDVPTGTGARKLKPDALGNAIEDLSEEDRARLFGSADLPPAFSSYAASESDEDWRRRIEGTGQRDGEGDRLVKRARAAEALALYRERPTRPAGVPPTFVIQALADNAEWATREVNITDVITELRAELERQKGQGVPNMLRSRLYWLTRYALLAKPAALSTAHSDLLRDVASLITARGPVLLFPGILAVAEAMSPRRARLVPSSWFGVRGPIESETRMYLVGALHFRQAARFQPHLDALLATQRDFPARVAPVVPGISAFARDLDFLEGEDAVVWPPGETGLTPGSDPLAGPIDLPRLNALLRELRRPVRVSIDPETPPAATVLLLRGLTSEIHRPLRAAVARLAGTSEDAREGLRRIARACVDHFSFRTREFIGEEFEARLARDVAGLYTVLIPFADRCRRLPALCTPLAGLELQGLEANAVRRVADAFLKWDSALCAGLSSDWPAAGGATAN